MYLYHLNSVNCRPKSQLCWEPRMAQDKVANGLSSVLLCIIIIASIYIIEICKKYLFILLLNMNIIFHYCLVALTLSPDSLFHSHQYTV